MKGKSGSIFTMIHDQTARLPPATEPAGKVAAILEGAIHMLSMAGLNSITTTDQVIYVILLLIGLAVCFFGYRLFRVWLFLAGLQVGFLAGLWLGGLLFKNELTIMIVAIGVAILVACLTGLLLKIGGFLAGAGVMVILALFALQLSDASPQARLIALPAAVVIGGILGVFSVKPFLILATAVNGAYLAADSVFNLIARHPAGQYLQLHSQLTETELLLLLAGTMVLAILGAIVQFRAAYHRNIQPVQRTEPPGDDHGAPPPPDTQNKNP